MEADRIVEGLNDAQRLAVTSEAQPLCVLAGAGSGKTRVLTRRIAWQAATGRMEPRHVVALTFTRKAAGELAQRLRSLGLRDSVVSGTFHSVAYAQLRSRWADQGVRPPTLLERKVGFVARLLPKWVNDASSPLDIVSEIEWSKARLVPPEGYEQVVAAAGRKTPVDPSAVASIYARYEEEKTRRHVVDFDDLLTRCRDALKEDREFAAAQRWRFRHFFVDEFQDVNAAQHELLEAWLGDRYDLCVVGDPNQAIYAWNGADAGYLEAMSSRYPSTEVVRLSDNYRSSPEILAAANRVLGGRHPLRANRESGPAPTVRKAPDDASEASAIARTLRDKRGTDGAWSDQAVLVRTHAQAAIISKALTDSSIPHRLRVDPRSSLSDDDPASASSGRQGSTGPGSQNGQGGTGAHGHGSRDVVEVVTFHAAKGLEWPIVHVAGLEQGLVPIGHARTPAALAEERRLLYVALTRAERELHCTWAEQRTFGSRKMSREPSMFLDRLQQLAPRGVAPRERPGSGRSRSRSGAAAVVARGPQDPAVLTALREWRLGIARAAAVPAYVVFNDRTLEAIATARPRTTDELLALPGIGEVKASRYGEDVLRLVASAG